MFPLPFPTLHRRPALLVLLFAVAVVLPGCGITKIRAMRTDIQMKDARIMQLEQDLNATRAQLAETKNRVGELLSQIDQRNETIVELRGQLGSVEEKLNTSRAALQTSLSSQTDELNKRFASALENEHKLKSEIEDLKATASSLEVRILEEEQNTAEAEEALALARDKLETETARAAELEAALGEKEAEVASLTEEHEKKLAELTSSHAAELKKLQESTTAAETQLDQVSTQLTSTTSDVRMLKDQLDQKEKERLAAVGRAAELEEKIVGLESNETKQSATLKAATPEAVNALVAIAKEKLGFAITAGNARVQAEGDKVEIILFSDALFDSGTTLLTDAGLRALQRIDEVVQGAALRQIIVEGHTDNVPLRNMPYPDNWELASARANEVVRWLAAQPGTDPALLVTVSRAYHDPIGDNTTAAGRRQNRRVEINLQVK